MAKAIVSCVNLKGGVGKTTIAVNFAAYCGRIGLKTLLVDLDSQTNATFCCMTVDDWKEHAGKYGTVANLLGARRHTSAEDVTKDINDVIIKDIWENLDLIPSHLDLITIDLDLSSTVAREFKLRKAIKPVENIYDIIVCDCPPNLTIPTQNALAFSTHYVVPVSPDYLSGIGVGLLLSRVNELSGDLEHDIKHAGIVVSRRGRPASHRDEVITALRQKFRELVFKTEIKERSAVSEAASKNLSVYDMSDGNACSEFSNMSKELLIKIGVEQ